MTLIVLVGEREVVVVVVAAAENVLIVLTIRTYRLVSSAQHFY